MKNTIVVLLLVMLVVLTFVCTSLAQDKPAEGMYFRLVTHGGDDPFWAVVAQGAYDAAEQLGAGVDIDFCGGDLALQMRRFEEAVSLEPEGIALVINDDVAWNQPVADALAAGIPVIGMNTDHSQGSIGNPRLAYVGQDDRAAYYRVARRVFEEGEKMGFDLATTHVLMPVETPGANYGIFRSEGVLQAMEDFGITSYEILDASYEMTTAEARITSYLLANPQTTFIFGLGALTTSLLADAMRGAGLEPGEVLAGGGETLGGTLDGIRTGYITATSDQQQYMQGYFSVYVLYLYNAFGLMPNVDTGGRLIDDVGQIDLIEQLSPYFIR